MPAKNDLDAVVSDAAYYLVPQLTEELRAAAKNSGWPTSVIESLTVTFDGSNIIVDYPKQFSQLVDNLEYGNESNLPNSVIRSFIYRSGDTVKSVLADRTVSNLFDLEGVFNG